MKLPNERILIDLQEDLADACRADSYLSGITVVTDRTANILQEVQKSLGLVASKNSLGLCIVVLQPVANDAKPGTPIGPMTLDIVIKVLENPPLNKSAKVAHSLCRRIVRIFKHFLDVGRTHTMGCDTPCIVPVEDDLAPVCFEVRLVGHEHDPAPYLKVMLPTIAAASSLVGALVTITCPTDGATIYYREDGAYPLPGKTGTKTYTEPFASTGALISAMATKTDYLNSDVNRITLTEPVLGDESGNRLTAPDASGLQLR